MATRKVYTPDFKLDAVKLVTERGMSRSRVARDLGIGTQTLRNWLHALAGDAPQTAPKCVFRGNVTAASTPIMIEGSDRS